MNEDPNPYDWMCVGNDLRVVLNDLAFVLGVEPLPMMTTPTRCPTEAEMAEFDRVQPGMADRLRKMAYEQMLHRQRLEAVGALPAPRM